MRISPRFGDYRVPAFFRSVTKDVILVSGFNVYPNEIGGVVQRHPGELECTSVTVPAGAPSTPPDAPHAAASFGKIGRRIACDAE